MLASPDVWFANPDTAARDTNTLRKYFERSGDTVSYQIQDATMVLDYKEMSKLMTKQAEIERMITFIGGPLQSKLSQADEDLYLELLEKFPEEAE